MTKVLYGMDVAFTLTMASSIMVGMDRLSLSLSHSTSNAFSLTSPGIEMLVTPGYLTAGGGAEASFVPSFVDLSSVVAKHVRTLISSNIFSDKSRSADISLKHFFILLQSVSQIIDLLCKH